MNYVCCFLLLLCIGILTSCSTNNPRTEFSGITQTFENGQFGGENDPDDWRVQVLSGTSEPWLSVGPCYPNPVSGSRTTLQFTLQKAAYVVCDVINENYDRVLPIFDGSLKPGTHAFAIDLSDFHNTPFAPGMYRLIMRATATDNANDRASSYGDIRVDP